MTIFLRSDAVLVPASHFQDAGGARALQVQLSIEVTKLPDDEAHLAREHFKVFLDRAPTFEFRLCDVKALRPNPDPLARLGSPLQPATGDVLTWLDARTDIWQRDPEGTDADRSLSAGQLVGASAGWAPSAVRDAGLAVTLILPAGVAATGKILLPYLAGFEPVEIAWVDEDGATYAVYTIDATGEGFRVKILPIAEPPRVKILPIAEPPPQGNELVDGTTGMVTTAGGAAPDEEAHLVHEMLGSLALRGASQLSSAHALLGIIWPPFEAANSEEESTRSYGRLVFSGVAALTSLFDPILLSLVMPGSSDEGPFIGAMMTALDEVMAGEPSPRALDEAAVDITVRNLKQRIGDHLALPGSSKADRTAFAEKLTALLALAPKPDEAQEKPFWPDLLLVFGAWEPGTPWIKAKPFDALSVLDIEQRLTAEIGQLLQWLESEDGSEAVALGLIKVCIGGEAPNELSAADKALALSAFATRLKSNFNGADATRAAIGTLLVDAFVKVARGLNPYWSADALRTILANEASNWFLGRIWKSARTGSVFEPLLTVLPTLGPLYLHPGDADAAGATGPLADQLGAAWRDVRRQLLGNSDQLRFADSKIPQPLPIRINADADIKDGDVFAHDYAGLGVLIRREGEAWAHANLATIALPDDVAAPSDEDILGRPIWVQPLDPAAVNGRREIFKNYDGFAFFEADLGPNPAGERAAQDAPYHTIDAPHRAQIDAAGLKPLPALAYGTIYELAAFAILRGGLLPSALAVAGEPWKPSPAEPAIAADYIARRVYSRTTMIGAVQLAAEGLHYSSEPGVGVQPLSDDYPRKGIIAEGATAWLDLWRSSDGSGAIDLPDIGHTIRLAFDELAIWGPNARIGIHIESNPASRLPDPGKPQLSALVATACAGGRLDLIVTNDGAAIRYALRSEESGITIIDGGYAATPTDIGGNSAVPVFLRLSLASDAGPISLSFADPAQSRRGEEDASSKPSSKVLLVAPNGDFVTPREMRTMTVRLDYPRVGYQDFERWLSNPKLAQTLIADKNHVAALLNLLLRSYLAGAPKLAERIASLPDPAVRHLLIELMPLDGLRDEPSKLVKNHKPVRRVIALDSFDKIAEAKTLADMFSVIDDRFGAEWTIKAGAFDIDPIARRIAVPEGMTAQLSVRPLVADDLFSGTPALDPRLLQWAQGSLAVEAAKGALAHIFEGPTRVIEMMASFADALADFADPAFAFVGVRDGGVARAYELFAAPPQKPGPSDWQWRRFASAEVKVQQWRFMGRPIQHWFDPKTMASSTGPGRAALRLDQLDHAKFRELAAFEAEAFLDRDDDDAQLYNVRLAPLDLRAAPGGANGATSLHLFELPDASATIVRHRLALFGRYIGALAKPKLARVDIIGADRPLAKWRDWLRVVMLADAARIELTRPQLRALHPLTVASGIARSPPVLALLDEAPFVHGGLAGRIAAAIRTGLSYAIPKPAGGSDPVLELEDARAEFGPDPQLRYHPTDRVAAQALTLLPEGPIGLTFDAASVRAPAFANSAMLLAPHILSREGASKEADLQEHFLSVALRRYLDPRWTVDDLSAPSELPADRSWWLECSDRNTLFYDGKALCTVERKTESWTIAIADRRFVFSFGKRHDPLDLAVIDSDQAASIALVHQPLANGRASLTVFANPSAMAVEKGAAQTPLVLASVEWSAPDAALLDKALTQDGVPCAYPVVASAETPMDWVRTARDSDRVTLADESGTGNACHVRDLRIVASSARIEPRDGGVPDRHHLQPAHEDSAVVLEVQRHLVLIKTRSLAGPGQMIETYEGTHLITGAILPIAVADLGARARIAELEVKAVPIGAGDAIISDLREYLSAHFDLLAIGQKDADILAFWIRPAKSFRACGKGFSLAFNMDGRKGSAWPSRRVELRPTGDAGFEYRTILLCASGSEMRAWFVRADGTMVQAAAPLFVRNEDASHGDEETVRISKLVARDAGGSLSVWWGDIAMLTLKSMPVEGAQSRIEFDFDWLFTGTTDRPADAVSPLGIKTMKEAQARLLGTSEPIDII